MLQEMAYIRLIAKIPIYIIKKSHYTLSKKTNMQLYINSSNVNRFSKYFHHQNRQEICNKTVVIFPATP